MNATGDPQQFQHPDPPVGVDRLGGRAADGGLFRLADRHPPRVISKALRGRFPAPWSTPDGPVRMASHRSRGGNPVNVFSRYVLRVLYAGDVVYKWIPAVLAALKGIEPYEAIQALTASEELAMFERWEANTDEQ